MADKFESQGAYDDGYRAGAAGRPQSANDRVGTDYESDWDWGWRDGSDGKAPALE